MNSRSGSIQLGLILLTGLIAGCSSAPPDHFYSLSGGVRWPSVISQDFAPQINVIVADIPENIDRPEVVTYVGPHEMRVDDHQRWVEPLRGAIARLISRSLSHAFPNAWVSETGLNGGQNPVFVTISITAMEAMADGNVRLDASWLIRDGNQAHHTSKGKVALIRKVNSQSAEAAVEAWSDELTELTQHISTTLAGQVPG